MHFTGMGLFARIAWRIQICVILGGSVLSGFGGSLGKGEAQRAALFAFTSDENSWEEADALEKTMVWVQAELSKTSTTEWVERVELEQARKELEASATAGSTQGRNLQIARWNKADWYITARLFRSGGEWQMQIEVVDVLHADVLAERKFTAVAKDIPAVEKLPQEASSITREIQLAMGDAARRAREVAGQPTVAVLMNPQFSTFEDAFTAALAKAGKSGVKLRVLRFPRAALAGEETTLVAEGFAESGDGNWQNIADYYLWGSMVRQIGKSKTGAPLMDGLTPKIRLSFWDGNSPVVELEDSGAPVYHQEFSANLAEQAERLAVQVLDLAGKAPAIDTDDELRKKISLALLNQAVASDAKKTLTEDNLYSTEGRQFFYNQVQTLETACFFDPLNREAQEKLLRTRWSGKVEQYSVNLRRFNQSRSEAWGRFFARLGAPPPISQEERAGLPWWLKSAAHEYVDSACDYLHEVRNASTESTPGARMRIPSAVKARLVEELIREVAHRAQVATPEPDVPLDRALAEIFDSGGLGFFSPRDAEVRLELLEKIRPALSALHLAQIALNEELQNNIRGTFARAAKPGGEAGFFDLLPSAGDARRKIEATEPKRPPFPQPPIRTSSELAGPKIPSTPKPPGLEIETLGAPDAFTIFYIHRFEFLAGVLWIIAEGNESTKVESADPTLAASLRPTKYKARRLFRYDRAHDTLEKVKVTASLTPLSMLAHGGKLWLACGRDSIAQLDPITDDLRVFGAKDGLEVTDSCELAAAGGQVFATVDNTDLAAWDPHSERWSLLRGRPKGSIYGGNLRQLSGLGDKLAIHGGEIDVYDVPSASWKQIATPQKEAVARAQVAGKAGVWFGGDGGLSLADLAEGKIARHFACDGVALPGPVTALATDGDYLWVAASHGKAPCPSEIMVLHQPSGKWVSRFTTDYTISLAVDDRYVWMGQPPSTKCLKRFEKKIVYEDASAH